MIDDKDVKKLIEAFSEVFPTKEDVVSKKEFESFMEEYHNDMDQLQKSVDAYDVKADKYFQEHTMLSNKVDRQEKLIEQLARKS